MSDFEARFRQVFGSEHTVGRESMAAACLECFPEATATEIISFLAKQSVARAEHQQAEGARELAAIIKSNSAKLDPTTRH